MLSNHALATLPAANALDVGVGLGGTTISITFDEAGNGTGAFYTDRGRTVPEMITVQVWGQAQQAVAGTAAYDAASRTMTFVSPTPRRPDTRYKVQSFSKSSCF